MKTTLWLTTFAMFAASPLAFSENDPSTLRTMVTERDRQIRQLEEENMKLRSLNGENVKPPAPKTSPATTVKNESAPAAPSVPVSTGGSAGVYTVKSGDTLAKIGRKVNSSPETLARLNGIKDPTKLRIGQKLKLPGSNANIRTAAAAPSSPKAPIPSTSGDTYVVRDGDTFYSIARKFKLSADSLIAANPDIKPSAMRTGQLVRLHGKSSSAAVAQETRKPAEKPAETAAPKKPAETSKPIADSRDTADKPAETAPKKPVSDSRTVANHPATAAQQQSPSPAKAPESPANAKSGATKESVKSVIVDGETTYGEFAAKHGMQIDKLNELNGLALSQTTVLAKGSELYVNAQP